MNDLPETPVDAGTVRYLRILVTVLTVTMVVGFIVIVVLFVIRFSEAFGPAAPTAPASAIALPDSIALPEGARAAAFTQGRDWYAIVIEDDRILIYDRRSGALRQTITIE